MYRVDEIIFNPTLFAAVAAACIGFIAFWSNPKRAINRVFFTGSLHVAIWLTSLNLTLAFPDGSAPGLMWLRFTCSIGALLPLHTWVIQQILGSSTRDSILRWISYNKSWIAVSCVLAIIPFTRYFIPPESTAYNRLHGWGYYAYIPANILLYGIILTDAMRSMRISGGVRRLEIKVWITGGCIIGVAVFALMMTAAATGNVVYIRVQPFVVLVFYAGTAFAMTTHRIFDARQMLLIGLEKALLVVFVSVVAFWLDHGLSQIVPSPFELIATTGIALWFASILNGKLDHIFQFYPQATEARHATFAVARRETRGEALEAGFCAVLKGWGQSEHAVILTGSKGLVKGSGIETAESPDLVAALLHLRWVTPERLARERPTAERAMLSRFLAQHALGVLVVAEGPSLTALVGVGTGASRRPFTYPQVTQLMELAAIIQAALERAHFSAKVQHTEQLATVGLLGASLAHEIRNPLVSIKTFVQLLPTHYQDAKFREKFFRLISDEVGRIDQLTEQLLDLASPRTYVAKEVELHPVLQASLDLVAAKAADRGIEFRTELAANPDRAFTDASAAKQVMLNLCFNAIQAIDSEPREERWVKIATRNTSGGLEMIVADSGPGIAPEMQARLFQPFQTTKSTGFGLGLAICSDILANLNASIRVDPAEPGRGAIFRVTFPCQPLLS